ncbi:hypothetical protein EL17_19020 [Anditalea andensis]|uniref:Uncharacterized protein n=1 Tax=Anditalea andensis TaxID=1048983 RepID=A0A074KPY1_9BACT|nr:hypothetical protein EL17_19020 [Anditalea andensis]
MSMIKFNKLKAIYAILFLINPGLFLVFRLPYQQYIYENNVYDFHFADVAPNFFSVFMVVFFHKSLSNDVNNKVICIGHL